MCRRIAEPIAIGQFCRQQKESNLLNTTRRCLHVLTLLLAALQVCAATAGQADTAATRGFELVRENPSVNGERRQVLRFEVDGLEQFALLLWPGGEQPLSGWPVLLFNHGYHPDPPNYGRNAQGKNDRPGDYYRAVAQAFVDRGLVVLVPDFRGHNASQGLALNRRADAPEHYARDTVAAFRALDSLDGLDSNRRYMLGHSMGGPVTLAALDELRSEVAAASIWSSMAVSGDARQLPDTGVPLLVQHARADKTTPAQGSEAIVRALQAQGAAVQLQLYDSEEHLFTGDQFHQAVERDLAWFAQPGS
jgi:uncharacterized protein